MSDYLVFQLYAPLVSWGTQAVGEERPIEDHPTRSSLLGLLAAALGIDRNDDARQQSLSNACRFGIKLISSGLLLRDYHTSQVPPSGRKKNHLQTRRDELRETNLGTILSYRSYLQDALNVIAVESLSTEWPLSRLQHALEQPRFHIYFGRKSCPPALPLNPRMINADILKTALDNYELPDTLRGMLSNRTLPRYFWEAGMNTGIEGHYRIPRHDQPISHRRWQFGPRDEYVSLGGDE